MLSGNVHTLSSRATDYLVHVLRSLGPSAHVTETKEVCCVTAIGKPAKIYFLYKRCRTGACSWGAHCTLITLRAPSFIFSVFDPSASKLISYQPIWRQSNWQPPFIYRHFYLAAPSLHSRNPQLPCWPVLLPGTRAGSRGTRSGWCVVRCSGVTDETERKIFWVSFKMSGSRTMELVNDQKHYWTIKLVSRLVELTFSAVHEGTSPWHHLIILMPSWLFCSVSVCDRCVHTLMFVKTQEPVCITGCLLAATEWHCRFPRWICEPPNHSSSFIA